MNSQSQQQLHNHQNAHHNGQHGSDNSKLTSALWNCFGNKSNVSDSKDASLRSSKQQHQQQQGCRGCECCGIRQTGRLEAANWLECDDEAVRIIPVRELQDKLAPNPRNSATPYLLFYVRSTPTTTATATATSTTT